MTRHDVCVKPAVVLWDFGDTLVDERWMRRCPESCPSWETAWIAVMNELADSWNVGDVAFKEVSVALALTCTHAVDVRRRAHPFRVRKPTLDPLR